MFPMHLRSFTDFLGPSRAEMMQSSIGRHVNKSKTVDNLENRYEVIYVKIYIYIYIRPSQMTKHTLPYAS